MDEILGSSPNLDGITQHRNDTSHSPAVSITCEYKRFLAQRYLLLELGSSTDIIEGGAEYVPDNFCLELSIAAQYDVCGGLLADKPGHGKTATTIGLIMSDAVDLSSFMPKELPDLPLRGTPGMDHLYSATAKISENSNKRSFKTTVKEKGISFAGYGCLRVVLESLHRTPATRYYSLELYALQEYDLLKHRNVQYSSPILHRDLLFLM